MGDRSAYWRRRYERAEAERLRLAGEVRDLSKRLIDIAADDLQQQVTALEQLVLKRAALVSMETTQGGRVLRLTFTRRGAPIQIDTYVTMDQRIAEWRQALLGE